MASFIFGLDLWDSARLRHLSRLLVLLWLGIHGTFVYLVFVEILGLLKGAANCVMIAHTIDGAIFAIMWVNMLWPILFEKTILLELLEDANRTLVWHVLVLILSMPYTICQSRYFFKQIHTSQLLESANCFCSIVLPFLRTFMIMIYVEAMSSLRNRYRSLLAATATPSSDPYILLKAKWQLRDSIRDLNELYATPLSLAYIQIFLEMIVSIGRLVTEAAIEESFMYLISNLCFTIQLYVIASKSSNLTDVLIEIERYALHRRTHECAMKNWLHDTDPSLILWQVLRQDERWDSLRVACFVHSRTTLISFLATSTTCVSVVLQFDFKLVKVISDLGAKFGNYPTDS